MNKQLQITVRFQSFAIRANFTRVCNSHFLFPCRWQKTLNFHNFFRGTTFAESMVV